MSYKVDELEIKLLNYRQDLRENLIVNDFIKISFSLRKSVSFARTDMFQVMV